MNLRDNTHKKKQNIFASVAIKQLEELEGRAQLEAFGMPGKKKKCQLLFSNSCCQKKKKNKVGACPSFLDVFTADNEFLPLDLDSTVSI